MSYEVVTTVLIADFFLIGYLFHFTQLKQFYSLVSPPIPKTPVLKHTLAMGRASRPIGGYYGSHCLPALALAAMRFIG